MAQQSLFDFGISKKRKADDASDCLASESELSKKQKTVSISDTVTKPASKSRVFQTPWLKQFEWLEYNEDSKRMFCKVCRAANCKNSFTKDGAG